MTHRRPIAITTGLMLAVAGLYFYFARNFQWDLAPFYPTPQIVVGRMLELGNVGPDDIVYDLGCGDGRIVTQAAERFGARGVGVEYDASVAQRAIDIVKSRGLGDRVRIIVGDALKVDVSPATVVTVYLLQDTMPLLRPIFDKSLKPGTRVVSHDWYMPGWTPVRTEKMDDGTGVIHTLWLYEIGKQY